MTNATRNHYARKLAEVRALKKSMREMLDCYWGPGDGEDPPAFIKRAARLSGWKYKPENDAAVKFRARQK